MMIVIILLIFFFPSLFLLFLSFIIIYLINRGVALGPPPPSTPHPFLGVWGVGGGGGGGGKEGGKAKFWGSAAPGGAFPPNPGPSLPSAIPVPRWASPTSPPVGNCRAALQGMLGRGFGVSLSEAKCLLQPLPRRVPPGLRQSRGSGRWVRG